MDNVGSPTIQSSLQKSIGFKSPNHFKQGGSVSAKRQVELQKEGQHLVIQLSEEQQALANGGARSKLSA